VKRSHPAVTLAVLSIGGLAYAVLSSAVVPALTTIQHDLDASETGIAWVLTGYLLSASVGTAIIGRLGDMFGKERALLWTLGVLAGGTLLGAVAGSLTLLIVARVIQGVGGGIFPLSFGIIRDEFPREKVPGSIGLMSSILGVGGGVGIVLGGVIVEHLGWQWLFWMPLALTAVAGAATWRFIPESPVQSPGRINWVAAGLMTGGISTVLIAITETTTWGWGSPKVLGLLAAGLGLCAAWVAVETHSDEPLIDMRMMRLRGVWTTNLVAFLLGAGMYSMFFVFPQFAQIDKSVAGFGFGASVVASGLYLLPSTIGVVTVGPAAGVIARRFGSRAAVIAGSALTASSFVVIAVAHGSPPDMLVSSLLLGVGIGLAFAALGNLIVEAVDPHQTGAAGGMNTVMRTIGGAIGGQLAATLIAGHTLSSGGPALRGFVEAFAMAAGFLILCTLAGFLIPRRRPYASRVVEHDAADPLEPESAQA
jgi:EmrB/QacA subfamily drug resistance transporter